MLLSGGVGTVVFIMDGPTHSYMVVAKYTILTLFTTSVVYHGTLLLLCDPGA